MLRLWRRMGNTPLQHHQKLKVVTKGHGLGAELYRGLTMTLRVLCHLICEILEHRLNGAQVSRIAIKLTVHSMVEFPAQMSLRFELDQLAAQGNGSMRRLDGLRRWSMSMASFTTM
ncbi:hypothetical protein PF007_g8939 [Phytophthora fragariae]|uniref:Uncharacterized protein n=2 Tax=Phytophthora TaxID=4783 RepID=A0A6A4ET56_9STRA|nr:hypothetical protein PF003_g4871 [Phytophthora fragariae]KAE9118397.1 hypothetical protein PF007_g8939 [Phytophthora fragariae]KAE9331524.1 hypothetical protein PR003_g14973 [Phytophthora rubi]